MRVYATPPLWAEGFCFLEKTRRVLSLYKRCGHLTALICIVMMAAVFSNGMHLTLRGGSWYSICVLSALSEADCFLERIIHLIFYIVCLM